ncbi:hypothetical protein NQ035_10520 [Staphylococcus gallinarum]|uniref:hypothetical protein n=1 Tax=Staphylococcus gallinarum TaxID=1293 RepID=UPI00211CC2AE|nr:hypothetical protein [Staphylococcus gallinarum]MCQ9289304.1 hypothetical protein [Staphylococcus gallinarum]
MQYKNDVIDVVEGYNFDGFFSLQSEDNDIVPVDNTIYFNELDTIILSIANDKEYLIFWLISEGQTYEEVGRIFNFSWKHIRQIFDGLLEKLP